MFDFYPLFIHCINTQRGCHTLKKNSEYKSHKVPRDCCGFIFRFIRPGAVVSFEGISCLQLQDGKEATKRWCIHSKLHGVTYRTAVTAITLAAMRTYPWQSTRGHKKCRSVMRIEFSSSEEATDVISVPVNVSCGKDHRWRKRGDTADRNGRKWRKVYVQGGSNMTGTDLCVNKPQCAAAVRPWESEATTSTLPPARVRTCSILSGSC